MRSVIASVAVTAALLLSGCGAAPPTAPPPPPPPPPPVVPPANNLPVIDSIKVQGTRAKEPASFADIGESVPIVAAVHDDETAPDQLEYQWSATVGTFTGSGSHVVWQALSAPETPTDVTITLKVVEKYGFPGQPPAFQQDVSGTTTLSLHDSSKEVGDMSRQFLLDFSDSNIRDVSHILRNFSKARCPQPEEVDSEADDIARNRRERRITDSSVGSAFTTVNFGGLCPFGLKKGDACAIVPVFWADIDLSNGKPSTTRGNDIVAAAYAPADKRWWLCASNYQGLSTVGTPFRFSR
jgi:hypothetical protein